MKRSVSRASKVSTDGQDPLENTIGNVPDAKWYKILLMKNLPLISLAWIHYRQEFLEKEETDLFILGLREEIVQKCIDICFETYLQKQAVAFTVYCASLACCKVLNIYYMFRDPGDIDDPIVKESWEPDSEPEPSVIDSWGSYCIEHLPSKPPVKTETKKQERFHPPSSSTGTFMSGVESCSFVSELFDFGEAEDFSPYCFPSFHFYQSSSDKNGRKSLFTRTLSSSVENLSLSCLKIFKMGDEAQKKPSDTRPTCESKSDESFD